MRDNTLVRNLAKLGWDVELVPAYTPIRTDEEDVSVDRVFLGGINLYLRHKVPLARWLPTWMLSWLDHPTLLRRATARQVSVDARSLGPLTLATISGETGVLRQEYRKFVRWLRDVSRPDLLNLTNLLIGGGIPLLRRELPGVPIVVTLQGDDLFLGQLVEPWKSRVLERMRELAREVDRFVTFSSFYADLMSELLDVPRDRFSLVPLGIELPPPPDSATPEPERLHSVIGYFARICPEKGFHHAIDAFVECARLPGRETLQFQAGGWLGLQDRPFFDEQMVKLERAGLRDRFHYVGSPDGEGKRAFFREIDLFSVPADFLEPKGLYVLEALAAGIPVVQPAHGSFPELLRDCPAATLVEPRNPQALAAAWDGALRELDRHDRRAAFDFVATHASAAGMAKTTSEIYQAELIQREKALSGSESRAH